MSYMAYNGVKDPLLPKQENPQPRTSSSRGLRRSKSTPRAAYVPPGISEAGSVPNSETITMNLHPSFRKLAIILVVYLAIGTICFYIVRDGIAGKKTSVVLDALYFSILTMTTSGYGDLVPTSVTVKLLACAYVFTGMALVGMILSKAADFLVQKKETLLVKALNMHQKVSPTEVIEEIATNRVRYKCVLIFIFLLVLILSGTAFLVTVENMDIIEAFYCVCATITTLGYGFESFSTEAGRIFAVLWIVTSTICVAQFFLSIAELTTENRRREFVKWVITRRMTNVDLKAADLDDDGVVGTSEFIIYKLKEMGKVTEEDIALVMKEFEQLDVGQTGTLSVSDLTLAQSSKLKK